MTRLLSTLALAVFLAAMVAIALASVASDSGSQPAPVTSEVLVTTAPLPPTTTAPPPAPKPVPVKLSAAGTYDPEGDNHENDSLAPLAVDGDPTTYWKTEHYRNGFFKKGVGLVLDAGRRRTLVRVVVSTDGSGASAQILLGNDPAGPFHPVSPDRPLPGRTTFALRKGATGRYVVVWVTSLPQTAGEAHITEVRAFAQPG